MPAGVIHDIGYRRYQGRRLGRWHGMLALFTHSLRAAFGLGRPARSKVLPFGLLAVACLPAVVSGAVTAIAHVAHIPYLDYPYYLQLVTMLFVAAQAPQLIIGDVRFHVLPLYFSRPLERSHYVWAKLAAMTSGLLIVQAAPLLIMYGSALLGTARGLPDVLMETEQLLAGLGTTLAYALLLAALGLAVAAFTRRRAFAALAVLGSYLVSASTVSAIQAAAGSAIATFAGLFAPFQLLNRLAAWVFRTPPAQGAGQSEAGLIYAGAAAIMLGAAVAILHWRYRRLEA